jgi:hypothetical protein
VASGGEQKNNSDLNAPVPKRRRTETGREQSASKEKTTRSVRVGGGGKKKDTKDAEEDINSLFWLVEVRDKRNRHPFL